MDTRCALAVATAALAAAAGCTASSEGTTAVRAAAPPMRVGCLQVIDRTARPFAGGYRPVLGVVAAPPAYLPQVVRSTDPHWPYWEKAGMVVRANPAPVDVSVPVNWRGRAGHHVGERRAGGERGPVHAVPGVARRVERLRGGLSPEDAWRVRPARLPGRTRAPGRAVRGRGQVHGRRRVIRLGLALAGVALACGCSGGGSTDSGTGTATATTEPSSVVTLFPKPGNVWPMFGVTPDRANVSKAPTGITASNATTLARVSIDIPGTVDSSPIFVGGRFVVTTSYGKTLALDRSGHILWTYTPPGIDGWEGSAQITNASPAADPDKKHVYAVSPDGVVHKLNLADGSEVTDGGWPVTITRDPTHEKVGTALNISGDLVLATTGGYIGDAPPYQGHVVSIDRASGEIVHVWNSLCSDRHEIIDPSTCPDSDSAIWARAGAVVEPGTGAHPRRDRKRPVRREDRMGRQRARALTRRRRARRELDASQPGGAQLRRRRPRLDRTGARARCRRTALRHPGREGRAAATHA